MNNANIAGDLGFAFVSELAHQLTGGKLDIPAFPDNAIRIKAVIQEPEVTAEQVTDMLNMAGMGMGPPVSHSGPGWQHPNGFYGLAFGFTTAAG